MSLKEPESMEELVYFTNRKIDEKGKARVWVFKEQCDKCKKGMMGKPVEKGKVKVRASEYVCPECGNTVEKAEYEATLMANVEYTCPDCGNSGQVQIPYKRKKYQGADALVFPCEKCSFKIAVTKKMKALKDKKK